MNQDSIQRIFSRFQNADPNPTTELVANSHFELLIAVILSAQATDKSVNKATLALFNIANSPEKILRLGEVKLKNYIKTINFFSTKAKNIIKTCKLLVKEFNSTVPSTRAELESLAGVGRKTANVILNACFNQPTIAVDTHIFRVSNRTGLAPGKTPLDVELKLEKIIPKEYIHNAHHWLVLHGRYVCVARNPKCVACLINDLCEFKEKSD